MARSKRKGQGQVQASLSKTEFVQQWCLHILPKDFTKTRFFGAWSGSKRRIYTVQCQELSSSINSQASQSLISDVKIDCVQKPVAAHPTCAHCRGVMQCIVQEDRPQSRELFYGPAHPAWYEWTSLGKCPFTAITLSGAWVG